MTKYRVEESDGFFGIAKDEEKIAGARSHADAILICEAMEMRDRLEVLSAYKPVNDQVLVKQHKREAVYKGIILPEKARDKLWCGTVVAIGPGKLNTDGTRVQPQCEVGDVVAFHWDNHRVEISGEEYLSMRQDTILAVME